MLDAREFSQFSVKSETLDFVKSTRNRLVLNFFSFVNGNFIRFENFDLFTKVLTDDLSLIYYTFCGDYLIILIRGVPFTSSKIFTLLIFIRMVDSFFNLI